MWISELSNTESFNYILKDNICSNINYGFKDWDVLSLKVKKLLNDSKPLDVYKIYDFFVRKFNSIYNKVVSFIKEIIIYPKKSPDALLTGYAYLTHKKKYNDIHQLKFITCLSNFYNIWFLKYSSKFFDLKYFIKNFL